MHTILAQFEMKVNDKIGRFIVDPQAGTSEVKEMAYMILKWIGQIEDAVKVQEEAKKVAEAPKPDIGSESGVSLDGNQQ